MYARIEERSFWFAHRNEVLVAACRRLPPPGVLFDVGGGNGFVTLALRRAGLAAVVVEPGENGVATALARGLAPVVWATLEDAGFTAGSFPAAGLFDVLEHVEDDAGLLRSLSVLLQPEGRLYLTVPAHQSLWSAEDVHAGHFRRYDLGSLTAVLAGSGFTIEHATYFFAPLPVPIWLARSMGGRRVAARVGDEKATLRQHRAGGAAGAVLRLALRAELAVLRRGGRLPVGSSCLAVAAPAR